MQLALLLAETLSVLAVEIPEEESPRRQLTRNQILRRFFNIEGPVIFRAGGGGGFEDDIWTHFRQAFEDDDEDSDEDDGDDGEDHDLVENCDEA